jgi:small subunit ribosomal protein S9
MPTKKLTPNESEATAKPAAKRAAPAKKKAEAADEAPKAKKAAAAPEGRYTYSLGRRKRATATAKLWQGGSGEITVNDQPYNKYFKVYDQQEDVLAPLKAVGMEGNTVAIRVSGGGPRGQAEACRHALSRILVKINEENKTTLKKLGFMTRDPREKERKHYGLKKARKAPQWAKR